MKRKIVKVCNQHIIKLILDLAKKSGWKLNAAIKEKTDDVIGLSLYDDRTINCWCNGTFSYDFERVCRKECDNVISIEEVLKLVETQKEFLVATPSKHISELLIKLGEDKGYHTNLTIKRNSKKGDVGALHFYSDKGVDWFHRTDNPIYDNTFREYGVTLDEAIKLLTD